MGLDVIIGLATILVAIVGVGVALGRLTRELGKRIAETRGEIKGVRDELRSDIKDLRVELRGEIAGVRIELGGRIDAVAAELTRTRMAVARLEGHVLGVPLPDTATDAG